MELYRFGGDFKKLELGYALEGITANRLDVGLVDWHAIDKLVSLISGGISGIDDLLATKPWKPATGCCSATHWIWWKSWNWPR